MNLETIIETFELLDGWEERYGFIIELGQGLPPMPDEDKNEQTRVQGCLSRVWMVSRLTDGRPPALELIADSDAHIVRGLVAILLAIYSGKTPAQVLEVDIKQVFSELDLEHHLTSARRNGLFSMVERIRGLARAHL